MEEEAIDERVRIMGNAKLCQTARIITYGQIGRGREAALQRGKQRREYRETLEIVKGQRCLRQIERNQIHVLLAQQQLEHIACFQNIQRDATASCGSHKASGL